MQPETPFQLIEKINNQGLYQTLLFVIFSLQWFIGGILVLGASFLFLDRNFECEAKGLLAPSCHDAVCKLDKSHWESYLGHQYS